MKKIIDFVRSHSVNHKWILEQKVTSSILVCWYLNTWKERYWVTIMLNDYDEWLLCWMTMMNDSYAEWLLRLVIKMINMLHKFTLSILICWYLNSWKEKTILFNAYFIDAWSFTDSSRLFSEKVIELNDILNFSFADTWILEKRKQFYSVHTSLMHNCSQTWVELNVHSFRLQQIYLQFKASLRRWFSFQISFIYSFNIC